jgi:hypothetical protein
MGATLRRVQRDRPRRRQRFEGSLELAGVIRGSTQFAGT